MVASNIKSLNLKFSVWSEVHPNLIRSAALKSLSAWSHFLPDDELKLYMKNPWDAVLNLQSVWPWPVAFQCWICSIIQECFVMPAPLGDQQLMPMLMSCGCYWRPIESLAGIGDQMRGCWSPGLLRRQRDGICFIHSFNWTITPHVWPCRDSLSRSTDFTADWCMELIGLEELAVVACTCTCKSEVFSWPFPVHASCLPVLGPMLMD